MAQKVVFHFKESLKYKNFGKKYLEKIDNNEKQHPTSF